MCLLFVLAVSVAPAQATETARLLAPGDTVEIRCPDSARYCAQRTLSPAGEVLLPGLPPVKLEGLVSAEAAQWIELMLDRYGVVSDPQITVRQVVGKNLAVSISGLVVHPETRYLSPGLTLQEFLAEAVPQPGADSNRVVVVPVVGIALAVDPLAGPWPLRPGDQVQVIARIPRPEVFVVGGVERPGAIPFETGMTVAEAVRRAGGISGFGQAGGWRLAHSGDAYTSLSDTPEAMGTSLLAGDTVEVPMSQPMTALSVIGAVVQPSRVEFRKGTRLSAVIKAAGGLRPDANAAKIAIRSTNGAVIVTASSDPILKPGDWIIVPSSG